MSEEIEKTNKIEKMFRFLNPDGTGLEFGRDENQQDMMVFRYISKIRTEDIISLNQEEFEQLFSIIDNHFVND